MEQERHTFDDNKATFARNGVLFPIHVMSPKEMGKIRDRLEGYVRQSNRSPHDDLLLQYKVHMVFTWADDLVRQPAILGVVEDLIGPNILVWNTAVMMKMPHHPGFVSWHQDVLYWGNDPAHVVTAWVAIADSTVENGCMRAIPGSHKWDLLPHVDKFGEHNMLSRGQEIDQEIDETRAVPLVLRAGEASVHHTVTVHSSEPNQSDQPRIGYAITYIAPETTLMGPRTGATVVRGVDTHGHFDFEDARPKADLDPAGIAAHDEAMRPFAAAIYEGAGEDGRISLNSGPDKQTHEAD